MADGDVVADDDCWYRHIIDKRWINADGSIAEQALKGKALAPPYNARPWRYELSGRSLSRVQDVYADGQVFGQFISSLNQSKKPTTRGFHGVACASVDQLKHAVSDSDVIHTPLGIPMVFPDAAHSDFVLFNAQNDEELDRARTALQDVLQAINEQDCKVRSNLCRSRTSRTVDNQPAANTSSSVTIITNKRVN